MPRELRDGDQDREDLPPPLSTWIRVDAPVDRVWAFLTDPEQVVECLPGAELDEVVDERNFKGRVGLKVGPVQAKYRGDARFEELDAERHRMRVVGRGMGDGSADLGMTGELRALEDGATESTVVAVVNVGGRMAQVGSRLIKFVSDRLFDQFVARVRERLEAEGQRG